MIASLAEGLSVVGLVMAFPLLLLVFMISLEQLETWGLRNTEAPPPEIEDVRETVEAAVHDIDQLSRIATESEPSTR